MLQWTREIKANPVLEILFLDEAAFCTSKFSGSAHDVAESFGSPS
jgi:hypothetical protein